MKTKDKTIQILMFYTVSILIALVGLFLVFDRIRYGVEFTDETWYVAEPVFVSKGSIPYINNWQQAPGFSFPLCFIFKVYTMIKGTEGIIYFSRIIYLFFTVIISVASLIALGKGAKLIALLLPLLFVNFNNIYDVNYNTIGLYYLLLESVLLGIALENNNKYDLLFWLSGFLIARTVVGTPATALTVIFFIILLSVNKKWKGLLLFLFGGLSFLLIMGSWIIVQVRNFDIIMQGIKGFTSTNLYTAISRMDSVQKNATYLARFMWPALVGVGCSLVLQIMRRHIKSTVLSDVIQEIIVFLFVIVAVISYLKSRNWTNLPKYLWFISLLCNEKLVKEEYRHISRIAISVTISYFLTYILVGITNVYGFSNDRLYWLLIPSIMGVLSIALFKRLDLWRYLFFIIAFTVFTIMVILHARNFVYRDAKIAELTSKVDSGIWKGCYTTPEKANAIIQIEAYVKSITESEDDVLFLDWVSFAYLMSNGKGCSPTTLDPMTYSYGVNSPKIMFKYYSLVNKVPNKIIYIDFGRNEQLSIEDHNYNFNEFVNEYYSLHDKFEVSGTEMTEISTQTQKYRVLSYVLKNREKAIEYVNNYSK